VAGNGVAVTLPHTPGPPQADWPLWKRTFVDGHGTGRRLAGDDTIEGDCVATALATGNQGAAMGATLERGGHQARDAVSLQVGRGGAGPSGELRVPARIR